MNEAIHFPGDTQVSIGTGHGAVQGWLSLPAQISALVVLTHAGHHSAARDDALAVVLQHAGIGTLTLDLLTYGEERFADMQRNVSLLTRRLLAGLALIKRWMLLGEMPTLPIGLCAADDCSPAVLRVAAQRDRDIFAVVCRGGLIDRAGMVYLRALASPLLLFAGDDGQTTASNRRALRELSCRQELKRLPTGTEASDLSDSAVAFEFVARETAHWFVQHRPKVIATS